MLKIFLMKEKRKLILLHLLSTPPTLCIFWRVRKGVGCAEEGVGREDGRGCVTDIYPFIYWSFVSQNLSWIWFILGFFFGVNHLKVSKFSFSSQIQWNYSFLKKKFVGPSWSRTRDPNIISSLHSIVTVKKSTTPSIPRRSPIQVLTRPYVA